MVVWIWVLVIISIIGGILGLVWGVTVGDTNAEKLAISIISISMATLISFGSLWWLYRTEGGARARKTFVSETSGGLNRVVHVYDMEGDLIAEYEGKFDVDEAATDGITKIKFDMNGKRHIIYSATGTVIIDEVDK